MATQVDNAMVFQFDSDVLPVLETVISKTLEQSLLEVRQEEEMEFMRRRMEEMKANKKAHKNVMKQRQLEEKELEHVKNMLLAQHALSVRAQKQVQAKIASRTYAKEFIRRLDRQVFEKATENNFFEAPIERSVREFMPWLYAGAEVHTRRPLIVALRITFLSPS